MDFLNRHVWLKRALMLLAILVATPFAGYLLLFVEVAGLEVAFTYAQAFSYLGAVPN